MNQLYTSAEIETRLTQKDNAEACDSNRQDQPERARLLEEHKEKIQLTDTKRPRTDSESPDPISPLTGH